MTRALITIAVFAALSQAPLRAAGAVDPALRFQQLATEHFVIYFHQGEDEIARRLAAIAEDTWRAVPQPIRLSPPPRTHVVLVDQTEVANGFATPLPYDTVFVTAAWPAGTEFIGNTDDWLRLVFTHEFTHIVHLDRSEGWARVVRAIFGRTAFAFPNVFLPMWQVEGLATYQESAITHGGRLHAGDFRAIAGEAARRGQLEPLDRVNGGLTDWPAGNAAYAYGLGFHQYLADRFGAETFGTLADATARRVPYTQSYAFRYVYGEPLGQLWSEYEASIAKAAPSGNDDRATRVTHHGFDVSGPRFDRFACRGCPARIVYSVQTPHDFPALFETSVDGSSTRHLTRRYLGSTTALGERTIFFDQQDVRRNVGLYSDLYALDRGSGRVRRLTREARLLDPDLSPDERTLVAVQENRGRRSLVLVDVTAVLADAAGRVVPQVLVSEPDTEFNAPRWSPDGRTIAVERHRTGHLSEVVLVDVATGSVREIASMPDARIATPAWRPDGRAIVAAVAPTDDVFNLIEFPLDGSGQRRLTHMNGGATWPDISPDGTTIVFVGYTVEGFDLFTVPYPERGPERPAPQGDVRGPERPALRPDTRGPERPAPQGDVRGPERAAPRREVRGPERPAPQERRGAALSGPRSQPYSPWPTLKPTSWSPVIVSDANQVRVGAGLAGVDVLGYHTYAVSATWLTSAPANASRPNAATPDWDVYYAYDRWRPTFWASASATTSFFSGRATDAGTPSNETLRAREFQAGVLLPVQHVRTSHVAIASLDSETDDYALADERLTLSRRAVRAGWATTTAHTYGYSISPERGVTIGATAERVPSWLGSSGDATAFTGDARVYIPGAGPHHVIAVRAAGGVSTGDPDVRRTFHLGGADPDASVLDFGRGAVSLLRGFAADTFAGSHVALLNADYRWPIARPQRGIGTWPVFLHTLHASVFADAGHAWTRTFRTSAIKTSTGAELSADIVAGYFFRFTLAGGAAWGHDGSGLVRDGATAYLRIGKAF